MDERFKVMQIICQEAICAVNNHSEDNIPHGSIAARGY